MSEQPAQQHDPSSRSTAEVLRDMADNARDLVQSELALAKLELRAQARQTAVAIALMTSGFIAGLFTLALLLVAATWSLAQVLIPTGAILVVAAVTAIVAALVTWVGVRKLRHDGMPRPDRAIEEAEKTARWVQQGMS